MISGIPTYRNVMHFNFFFPSFVPFRIFRCSPLPAFFLYAIPSASALHKKQAFLSNMFKGVFFVYIPSLNLTAAETQKERRKSSNHHFSGAFWFFWLVSGSVDDTSFLTNCEASPDIKPPQMLELRCWELRGKCVT